MATKTKNGYLTTLVVETELEPKEVLQVVIRTRENTVVAGAIRYQNTEPNVSPRRRR